MVEVDWETDAHMAKWKSLKKPSRQSVFSISGSLKRRRPAVNYNLGLLLPHYKTSHLRKGKVFRYMILWILWSWENLVLYLTVSLPGIWMLKGSSTFATNLKYSFYLKPKMSPKETPWPFYILLNLCSNISPMNSTLVGKQSHSNKTQSTSIIKIWHVSTTASKGI